MSWSVTHAQIRSEHVRIHVYDYCYEQPLGYSRCPDQDVLALFATPPRDAVGAFKVADRATPKMPLGALMIVPGGTTVDAVGRSGEQRLASCTMPQGILPSDFDVRDRSLLALCSNIQDRNVRAGMQRLAREAISPGFASDLLSEGLARSLRVDLARYFGKGQKERSVRSGALAPWQLRKIEDYTRETEGNPVRVNELAAEVGISPGHLMRAFRQSTGQTVHEFVEEIRVARARTLLGNPQLPIKQIAAQLGFGTPSSFSLAFRRATGASPAQFRRTMLDLA